MADSGPSVARSFPQVQDYAYNSQGRPIMPVADPVMRFDAREQRVRERATAVAHTKLIQQELRECYHREGVNHIQNCKELAQQYMWRIRAPDFGAHLSQVGFPRSIRFRNARTWRGGWRGWSTKLQGAFLDAARGRGGGACPFSVRACSPAAAASLCRCALYAPVLLFVVSCMSPTRTCANVSHPLFIISYASLSSPPFATSHPLPPALPT